MVRATLKNLGARKLRLLTTALSVLLGVAFMAGTMVLTDTVTRTFDDLFATVYKGVDAQVRSASKASADGMEQRARIDESLVATVKAVDGVRDAAGGVLGYTQIVGRDGKAIGNPGRGAPTFGTSWHDNPAFNAFHLVEGRAPAKAGEITIDRFSATRGRLHVGDTTTLLVNGPPVQETVVGITRFGAADSPGGASIVQFPPAEAQRLAAEPGKFDSISVQAANGVTQTELQKRLRSVLPADVQVLTGAQVVREQQAGMQKNLAFFGTFMLAFALISLFVGAFIIYNTFSIIVAQRTREMALLRAIGASRRQVMASVVGEAAIVGLIASVLGVVTGIGVAVGLESLLHALGMD
ncbi:MAG TPA: ABC transporter permease, partial [Acidimicrobiales bacterium]|nr:ABC transporter permease [Acidimicrobiales bacterium]